MSATLFACAVALLPLADPQPPKTGKIETTPRKPHPLAPSLPRELTTILAQPRPPEDRWLRFSRRLKQK